MKLKGLIFGTGQLLRNEVDGWATTGNGTPHVYPDHPPLDLAASSYPRAAIDVTGADPRTNDTEKSLFHGDVLMDITVYAVNSSEIFDLVGKVHQAIIDHNDTQDYQTDDDGDELLSAWDFLQDGNVGPMIEEESEKGFTRYNKNIEFEWQYVTTKNVT